MDLLTAEWIDQFGEREFFVVVADDQYYATQHYWLTPVPPELQRLFNWWRLPLQSGSYRLTGGRLEEGFGQVPEVAGLMNANVDVERQVYPMKVGDNLVYVNIVAPDGVSRPHNVFQATLGDGRYIRARADFLDLAFGADWHNKPVYQAKRDSPLIHKNPLALVMPLREI